MLLRTIGTNTHEKQNAPNIINCALYNLMNLITYHRYNIMRNSKTTRGVYIGTNVRAMQEV